MSAWKPILQRDLDEIKRINYSRLNCILQDLADLFQKKGLTKLEVELVNEAINHKEMLNTKNAESFYRSKWTLILKSEGL